MGDAVLAGQSARQHFDELLFPQLLGEISGPHPALVEGNSASSDEAALLEALMDLFDKPDTWSESVTYPELQIDFSRISNPEVEDAIRSTLHDITGKAHDVQKRLQKIQNSYLELREGCATVLSDAMIILGDTERSTRISEVFTLMKGMDQGRREYKEAAGKHKANYDQLMVIARRADVD